MINFSFILPLYNCEKYIRPCVDNIMKLNRDDCEIILVNDGSVDNTEEICKQITKDSEVVKYIYQQNRGVSIARNTGLKVASGEYVIFVDADDEIEADKLNSLLNKILDKPETDMVIYGLSFDYYYKGKCYRRDELSPVLNGLIPKAEWIRKLDLLYDCNALNPIWNKIIRRRILTDNKLEFRTDMFLYEDLEYSIRCMEHCDLICFSDDIVYRYRQIEGNAKNRLKRVKSIKTVVDNIEDALESFRKTNIVIYDIESEKLQILKQLYEVLAREKISVSNRKETKQVCENTIRWINSHKIDVSENDYFDMIRKRQITKLILKKYYISIRHAIAVKLKNLKK